ncbi:FAD/NAD-P-binding domain-containing protein [Crepidotus variabilis]|uniref:FAD/NAD-P-binding domain-containing protein n=1 Tax=Crepidotus variabilis TaxID=179855 RepID=A0A9P6JW15_9AGAR|nr:FAD/NAD-P-binding domain-containing protein [Crepidotus variabilis]
MPSAQQSTKLRVLIVGAGASGMSAAYAFSQHPDRFSVKVYERSSSCGGMATSHPIDASKYGASYINDGVQGASPVFHNTYAIFEKLGYKASEVDMQVSFGKDPEKDFWTNVFPSRVIDKHKNDIKKFGKALKVIKFLEPLFAVISVSAMLRMFGFSKEFGDVIVFPLVALFFGTGNQTPFISSAILERVFMDHNMRLFEYSPKTFLATIPKMCAFPCLSDLYSTWKSVIEAQSTPSVTDRSHEPPAPAVQITLSREVTHIKRHSNSSNARGSVEVWSRPTKGTGNDQMVIEPGEEEKEEFDEIIICTDGDAALKILGDDASWLEKKILGNVIYLWDITVTHNDIAYMEKYYRLKHSEELESQEDRESDERKKQFSYAKDNFRPLYFIRSMPEDKKKIEMSFDLTVYQPQFDGVPPSGPGVQAADKQPDDIQPADDSQHSESTSNHPAKIPGFLSQEESKKSRIPLENHVFQTIFLDKEPSSSQYWSKDEINADKVILEKWWKQQSHRWQHYAGTVPWMGLINGKYHTRFAGAWTILNMHEIAVVSGFAAAYQLGASYPFTDDPNCKRLFALCLAANHMVRMRKEDRSGIFT